MNDNTLPDCFQLPVDAAPVACVDVGGTKLAVSVVDARGVLARLVEPTAKEGAHDALALQIIRMLEQSCQNADVEPDALCAVGVWLVLR